MPAVIAGALLSAALAVHLATGYGARQAALLLVGLAAGVVLYHAAFGFTWAWREFAASRRGAGLRAQMVMLAAAVVIVLPLLAVGTVGEQSLRGAVAPLGVAVVLGAFLFGIGMQLGGGCASGTLFTAGGGSSRMVITLAAFIAGSVIGAWHMPLWQQAPSLAPVSLLVAFGAPGAIALSLLLFAAVWTLTVSLERRRHGEVLSIRDGHGSWLRGPWPLVAGALGLAGIQVATLLLAGRPWGVTGAFALWGSKLVALGGVDVAAWPYWQRPNAAAALADSVFADVTSVMNFGIVLGALTASGFAGRFAPVFRIPLPHVLAAVIGGLLLGYGARLAYGCNIGAYFGGIASSSLHGWLWFVAAFAGSALGTRMRPWFRLAA
ncbi:MAG: YeeE/YedE family protein [Pseudomonadales bacterium]